MGLVTFVVQKTRSDLSEMWQEVACVTGTNRG